MASCAPGCQPALFDLFCKPPKRVINPLQGATLPHTHRTKSGIVVAPAHQGSDLASILKQAGLK